MKKPKVQNESINADLKTHFKPDGFIWAKCGIVPHSGRATGDPKLVTCENCKKRRSV